jgi:signal transduction histidine kinase
MQNTAARMQTLIDSLIYYSRLAMREDYYAVIDMTGLAADVWSELQSLLAEPEVHIQLNDLPSIEADPDQMRLLFQQLLLNALTYARKDASLVIKISGNTSDESARFLVEDNGIGFDEKFLDRIFKPFQTLHSRSSGYEGVGMGLALCRKIVERHGGTITANSTPGKGSTFIISLPLKHGSKE